jgi:excisionase family DNA binding protein
MNQAPPIPPAERLQVRAREAAQLLSISERELRRLTQAGALPSIGRGRLRRYALEDLRAWQRRNRNGGPN